jgi:hypothetical protein
VPQAQAAQQRLKHASAPPCYGKISNLSKVHRRDGHLASVQMNVVADITHNSANKTAETRQFPMADNI